METRSCSARHKPSRGALVRPFELDQPPTILERWPYPCRDALRVKSRGHSKAGVSAQDASPLLVAKPLLQRPGLT
jgi:hypothetical protein